MTGHIETKTANRDGSGAQRRTETQETVESDWKICYYFPGLKNRPGEFFCKPGLLFWLNDYAGVNSSTGKHIKFLLYKIEIHAIIYTACR